MSSVYCTTSLQYYLQKDLIFHASMISFKKFDIWVQRGLSLKKNCKKSKSALELSPQIILDLIVNVFLGANPSVSSPQGLLI